MTPFKKLLAQSGLSVNNASRLLNVDQVTIRRWMADPNRVKNARTPAPIYLKTMKWYIEKIPPCI